MSKWEIIITADDFGLTEEGNKRIIDVYRNHTITDTSLIATGSPSLFYESVHQLKRNPELDGGMRLLSKFGRYRNKVRQIGLYTTDYFAGTVGTMKISQKKFFEILKKLPVGTTELLAHPGNSEMDYCTFTSSSLRMRMEKFNINLTSFRKLL